MFLFRNLLVLLLLIKNIAWYVLYIIYSYSLLNEGGTCEAWLRGVGGSQVVNLSSSGTKRRNRFGADLFGSLCYTFQHGRFRNKFGDLSRVDARLDIASASALAKKVVNLFSSAQSNQPPNELSSPRLNLIFQQQVSYIVTYHNTHTLDSKASFYEGQNRNFPTTFPQKAYCKFVL